jgi:hypothetical protein
VGKVATLRCRLDQLHAARHGGQQQSDQPNGRHALRSKLSWSPLYVSRSNA